MFPTIVKGDRVQIDWTYREFAIGDLVFAKLCNDKYVIHRLVALEPLPLTRGDNHVQNDVAVAELLGKVVKVKNTWPSLLRRWRLHLKKRLYGKL